MDFSGYVGAMTAINMINSYDNNERYKDANTEWTEENRMADKVKEVVHNPGVHGALKYTCGNFIVPSGKWEA
jgi:general stress protein 26